MWAVAAFVAAYVRANGARFRAVVQVTDDCRWRDLEGWEAERVFRRSMQPWRRVAEQVRPLDHDWVCAVPALGFIQVNRQTAREGGANRRLHEDVRAAGGFGAKW